MFKNKKNVFLISFLTLIGFVLHFYNLNWGAPFYFHPDERNIASAVSQLQFPTQMNPHFFAYGSLPMYVIYFTGILINYLFQILHIETSLQPLSVIFGEAILIGRAFSALFATALIPLLFILGKKIKDETTGILAALFATTSVGFIQFAHFGTFEMWLTFFGVLLFWICNVSLPKLTYKLLIFLAVISGILIAIKITSLALLSLPVAIILLHGGKHTRQTASSKLLDYTNSIILVVKRLLLFCIVTALVVLLTNPFVLLDYKDFLSGIQYESGIALGTIPVFYTEIFLNTVPGIYQLLHIYPFLLNPLFTILFIPTVFYAFVRTFTKKNPQLLLLLSFFLIFFLSQAFLFVKWTRYVIPTLPFIYLLLAFGLNDKLIKTHKKMHIIIVSLIILTGNIFAFSYFKTAVINTDTRISALTFAKHAISDTDILSETSDLGIVPFQEAFPYLDTFNFYDFDSNSFDATELNLRLKLVPAQYIILPSQRVLQSRIENPKRFPKGHTFYKALLNGTLGFHKIYETPCDIYCRIVYLGDPIYWWEQTVTVFDRPTVFIFKKESVSSKTNANSIMFGYDQETKDHTRRKG